MEINKNYLRSLLVMMIAMTLCVSMLSCGDSDSSEEDRNNILQNLKSHKWSTSDTSFDTWSDELSLTTQVWTIYFTSDTEGVIYYNSTEHDTYFGNSRDKNNIDFTYTVSDSKVYLYLETDNVWELTYYGSYMMWGNDMFTAKELTSSDYSYLQDHASGYHGTEGKIDTEVYIIDDNDILRGVNELENGWYSYVLQFGFGANSDDAYRKGMTQIRLTAWVDNGCLDGSLKTANYGKKKTFTLYLSLTEKDWYDWIVVLSKDTQITFNYELEYFNSKDGQWYEIQSRKLTFYK